MEMKRVLKQLAVYLCMALLMLTSAEAAQDVESYTYRLTQSTAAYTFWTTTPGQRVFKDDPVPGGNGSSIKVYAARNEFEPFLLTVRPRNSGNLTVHMGNFGAGITTELFQVQYVNIATATDNLGRTGPYPDPLEPLENGATVGLTANENTALWINVRVEAGVASGDYPADITVGGIAIPVVLHVFNFDIPAELHVKSQMNFSENTILNRYSVSGTGDAYWMYVDNMKQFFIDHRLTPKGVLWPGGITGGGTFMEPFIDYDCADTLTDNDGIWGFEALAQRYIEGSGLLSGRFSERFNDGAGFPFFMGGSFVGNNPEQDQRPSPFCGQSRSAADWYTGGNPNSAYNTVWRRYMSALSSYLDNLGYLDRTYHYFANEPQDQNDYDAVAWYAQMMKSEVPDLKLAVSEEPKPEIFNHPSFPGAKIDIWMPVLNAYDPVVSWERERDHGEESWVYFLHGTRPPYFNPITLDHPGVESKLTGWFLWKYRLRGIAYYSLNNWGSNPWTDPMTDGHNGDRFMLYPPSRTNGSIPYGSNNHRLVPSIRIELMRDSLEDYEYLYVLNSSSLPQVDLANPSDTQADKIVTGLTSYTRNTEFMYNLRRLIGLKNGGEISSIPDIKPPALHPRAQGAPGNYYINFQDPAGQPAANPLIVNGKEYMKIGWNDYDQNLGYGWYGDMAHVQYRYLDSGGNGVLQRSIIFDDWGREKTFEFDLPNGSYDVTVSAGWQGRTYARNQVVIEGVTFIGDEATSPYLVRTDQVTVADNKLTLAMGIFNEYTMLNYLEIIASGPDTAPPVINLFGDNPLTWPAGKPYRDPGATARDNVDGNLSSAIVADSSEVDVNTLGTYWVRYTVSDAAGNKATALRMVKVSPVSKNFWLLMLPATLDEQ